MPIVSEETSGGHSRSCNPSEISETPRENRNARKALLALTGRSLGETLSGSRVILPWISAGIGLPAPAIGMILPIHDAGAQLSRVSVASRLGLAARRKWAWSLGALIQGLAALAIPAALVFLEGAAAGTVLLLAVLCMSLARATCHMAEPELMQKTLARGQGRTGTLKSISGSLGIAGGLVLALLLLSGALPQTGVLPGVLIAAAVFWSLAAVVATGLQEPEGRIDDEPVTLEVARLWHEEPDLRRLNWTHWMLLPSTLAVPYVVLLTWQEVPQLHHLGALLLSAGAAAFLAPRIWERLSFMAPAVGLALSGFLIAAMLAGVIFVARSEVTEAPWVLALLLFGLMVSHGGVGRNRMRCLKRVAPRGWFGDYAGVSDLLTGYAIFAVGVVGAALSLVAVELALAGFATISALGMVSALPLLRLKAA